MTDRDRDLGSDREAQCPQARAQPVGAAACGETRRDALETMNIPPARMLVMPRLAMDPAVKKVLWLMVPGLFNLAVYQLNIIVLRQLVALGETERQSITAAITSRATGRLPAHRRLATCQSTWPAPLWMRAPASLVMAANQGRYDLDTHQVEVIGPVRVVGAEKPALVRLGHDVTVITPRYRGVADGPVAGSVSVEISGYRFNARLIEALATRSKAE